MNWEAGILAFLLLYVPVIAMIYHFRKRDQEINREYEEKLKQIKERYGVEL